MMVGLLAAAVAITPAAAALLSESFEFKRDVSLSVGSTTEDGLRLDTVRFRLPARVDGGARRTAGLASVEVAISNTGQQARKLGVAVALFDEQRRLVAVASGGSRIGGVKPGRQKVFKLVFEDVNERVHDAATFQISVESKP